MTLYSYLINLSVNTDQYNAGKPWIMASIQHIVYY